MSDRVALEDLLIVAKIDAKTTDETADDILRAGWRPPAREITAPTELDALPVGTVGITPSGVAWTRWRDRWTANGSTCTSAYLTKHRGPLTVVYIPTEATCRHDSRSGAGGRWRCDQCGPTADRTPTSPRRAADEHAVRP